MRIALLVEGKTETAFLPHLRGYLQMHLAGRMPKLDPVPYDGRIPTGAKLRRVVENLLNNSGKPADHVIALTDVYTGARPPVFPTAADAKGKLREWVGVEDRFHPHVALHDFEAWLLPYWPVVQRLAGHDRAAPAGNPEAVNHNNPPAHRISEVFRTGERGRAYVKPRDAARILRESDLSVAISQCSELKAFVNTIISVCGGAVIP
ncbi:MAG: DUF4276 family protein [Candidatus Riflebacteria bacterium]|nr:DUF4276 family protein [Candidatus Riflebacteria bacterium]